LFTFIKKKKELKHIQKSCLFADKEFDKYFKYKTLIQITIFEISFNEAEPVFIVDLTIFSFEKNKWIETYLTTEIHRRIQLKIEEKKITFINHLFDCSKNNSIITYTDNIKSYKVSDISNDLQEFQKYLYNILYRQCDVLITDLSDLYY
jgi:hypothetical protein